MKTISDARVSDLLTAKHLNKEKIYIINFLESIKPKPNMISGSISNINENNFEYSTEITEAKSPGSPIFNTNFEIIGLELKSGQDK